MRPKAKNELTFVNTNVTESDCILQKNKKQNKNESSSVTISLKPIFSETRDNYKNWFLSNSALYRYQSLGVQSNLTITFNERYSRTDCLVSLEQVEYKPTKSHQ